MCPQAQTLLHQAVQRCHLPAPQRSFAAGQITFRHIGKKSLAHKKAIETYRALKKGRGKVKARKITQEELVALLIE